MRIGAGLIVFLLMAGQAFAAPIWVERQFVPESALHDEVFLQHADAADEEPDYALWETFLNTYLTPDAQGVARVSYSKVTPQDREALTAFINAQQQIDVAALDRPQQLAFWINLYNSATVRLILDHYPLKSIRDIEVDGDGPWDTPVVTVSGITLTLNNIEHGVIRPVFGDARIHYAVNCASVGCPNLAGAPYTGETVDAMLTAAARAYVNHPRGVAPRGRRVTLSKIYGWYREDFGEDEAAVLDHIRQYADPDLGAALEKVKGVRAYKYDWDLNEAP